MKKRVRATLVLMCLMICAWAGMVGCAGNGSSTASSGTPQQEQTTLAGVQVAWSGYLMGIDMVTEDPELATPAGMEPEGKFVKVLFFYMSDPVNSGGFVAETLLDDLTAHAITLEDANATAYEWTKSIGNFILKDDFEVNGFAMAEIQPRFSIIFDVPAEASLEDFTLSTGNGEHISLCSYTSEEYAAEQVSN